MDRKEVLLTNGVFKLTPSAVTVNGSRRHVVHVKEVAEHVSHALGLDEDYSETNRLGGWLACRDIQESAALVAIFDLLGDTLAGGTDTANAKEDVILREVAGEHLDVTGNVAENMSSACPGRRTYPRPVQCGYRVQNPCPTCGRPHRGQGT